LKLNGLALKVFKYYFTENSFGIHMMQLNVRFAIALLMLNGAGIIVC